MSEEPLGDELLARLSVRELYFQLGCALLRDKRFAEGALALESALKEAAATPSPLTILFKLGSGYADGGNNEAGARAFLQAAAEEPSRMEEALALAAPLISKAAAADSLRSWMEGEWYGKLEAVQPSPGQRVRAAIFLSEARQAALDAKGALDWLTQAMQYAGDDQVLAKKVGESLYAAGRSFVGRNQLEPAVEAFRAARKLRPADMHICFNLADALRLKSLRTEPPYVSEEDISESLSVWDQAVGQRWPTKDESWGYLVRASINEPRARVPNADRWTLGWEALCYAERALVHSPDDSLRYVAVARWYRFLGLEASEDQATLEGLNRDEHDQTTLEERIICLANAGRLDEVEPLLARRREIDDASWTDAVEAFTKVRRGEPEAALELIEGAINDTPDLAWLRHIRAECYRRLRKTSEARRDYQWILDRYHHDDVEGQSEVGKAAFQLGVLGGNIGRAFEIFNRMAENRPLPTDAETPIYLGLCRVVVGDLEHGRDQLEHGIKLCRNLLLLNDLLDTDLESIEEASSAWPHGLRTRALLNNEETGLRRRIRARLRELAEHRLSAADELRQMLTGRPAGDAGGWLAVGSHAGLARLHAAAGSRTAAAGDYARLLRAEPARFPEARDALIALSQQADAEGQHGFKERNPEEGERSLQLAILIERDLGRIDEQVRLLQLLGDRYLEAGSLPQALESYVQASASANELHDGLIARGDIQARIGYVHLRLGDSNEAKTQLSAAMKLYQARDAGGAGERLGECLRALIFSLDQFWELEAALETFPDDFRGDRALRASVASCLSDILDPPPKPGTLRPFVTPVTFEISSSLVPLVDPKLDGGKFIDEMIPAMRTRIKADIGAEVPGVRARPNPAFTEDICEVAIDEVPRERGRAPLNRWYFRGPRTRLRQLKIEGHYSATTDPVTREPGFWLDAEALATVQAAGEEVWSTADYMIAFIEAVLRNNLARFVGIQETAAILEDWGKKPGGKELIQSALPTPLTRRRFAWVVQGLLAEQVPILDWEQILLAMKEFDLESAPLLSLLAAARMRLRQSLPGRNDSRIQLPVHFEEQLLGNEGGLPFLAASPKQKFEFLAWLRDEMESHEGRTVLVTESPDLRPLLRRLVAPEFPALVVLAEPELRGLNDWRPGSRLPVAEAAIKEASTP